MIIVLYLSFNYPLAIRYLSFCDPILNLSFLCFQLKCLKNHYSISKHGMKEKKTKKAEISNSRMLIRKAFLKYLRSKQGTYLFSWAFVVQGLQGPFPWHILHPHYHHQSVPAKWSNLSFETFRAEWRKNINAHDYRHFTV